MWNDLDISKIELSKPQRVKGNAWFSKLSIDNYAIKVQLDMCKSKQGILTTNNNMYIDLKYENIESPHMLEFFENIENKCKTLIFENKMILFDDDIEQDDIDSYLTSITRSYSGGIYSLIRCKINHINKNPQCDIYDESLNILSTTDVTDEFSVIPLVHISGIKFTNKNFQIIIDISQIMVIVPSSQKRDSICKINYNNSLNKKPITDKISLNKCISKDDKNMDKKINNSSLNLDATQLDDEHIDTNDTIIDNVTNNIADDISANSQSNVASPINNLTDNLEKIEIDIEDDMENIELKSPNTIYLELYRNMIYKANKLKQESIDAYNEAKSIKTKYGLFDLENHEDDNF